MPVNAHPDYVQAEKEYLLAQTLEEKLKALEKMISLAPKHKSSENMRAELKNRYRKLQEKIEKGKKSGKVTKTGIRKEDMQAVIIGFTKSGKSSLLSLITNAQPQIGDYNFTTKKPILGMMNYYNANIQIIENPAFESEYYDKGLTNSADTILILVTELEQIKKIEQDLTTSSGKRIIVFNKIDLLNENEKRKIAASLQSKKYNFALISTETKEGIKELKEKLFKSFNRIRVYTKEPGKERSKIPIILDPNSNVKDVAEKILHGFSKNVKETKIWGPSSKFSGQKVGLHHLIKDLDVVEFKTK
ncbi:MAG: GTPase [archaeon]|nr:GTPase [archaeon]